MAANPRFRQLSKDEITTLLDFCLANAQGLLDEAVLLHEHGKYARATALSMIALEELGKRDTLCRAVNFGDDQAEWKGFWKRFRSHETKISNTMFDSYLYHQDPNQFERAHERSLSPGRFTGAREAGLYTDLLQDKPHLPSAAFTQRLSSLAINMVANHVRIHQEVKPTAMLDHTESIGNRKPGESRRQWMERELGEIPPALAKMIDAFDLAKRR